jgi:hypothetical protein
MSDTPVQSLAPEARAVKVLAAERDGRITRTEADAYLRNYRTIIRRCSSR